MTGAAFVTLAGREWKTAWNDGAGYFLRCLYAGLLLAGGAIAWAAAGLFSDVRPEEYAEFSRRLFTWFFRAQFALASFVAAVSFARAFMREKERRSLDLLLVSPARPFSILLAKALGDFAGMLVVLLSGLPVLLFMLPLGGMTAGEVLSVQCIVVGQLAALGGVCALLAALVERPAWVMALGWLVAFDVAAGPSAGRLAFPKRAALWSALDRANPWAILDREMAGVGADFGRSLAVLGVGLGLMVALCFLGSLLLKPIHVWRAGRSREAGLWRRSGRALRSALASRSMGFLFRPMVSADRTLIHRECSLERDVPFRIFIVAWLALYGGAVAVACAMTSSPGYEERHAGIAVFGASTALFLLIVRGAVSIVIDKRNGKFEMLLAANVEPEEIVRARLAGFAQRGFYLLLAPVVHGTCALLMFDPSLESVLRTLLLGLAGLSMAVVEAALATLLCAVPWRGMVVATVVSLVVGVPAALFLFAGVSFGVITAGIVAPLAIAGFFGQYALAVRLFRKSALAR